MKNLFYYGNEYVKKCDWSDLALLKFCLFSMGLMVGMAMPKKAIRTASFVATGVFAATYLPLMLKFFDVVKQDKEKSE